jgi:CRISPR-associated protein Cas1
MLPPLKPIPIKERLSVLYVELATLDVLDGTFVAIDFASVRTHHPSGWCGVPDVRTRCVYIGCRVQAGSVGRYAADLGW